MRGNENNGGDFEDPLCAFKLEEKILTYDIGEYLKFSVLFTRYLQLGLDMYREKWTDKLAKTFSLSKKQDIVIGDKQIDSKYIIQGYYPEDIKVLLQSEDVKASIKSLSELRLKRFNAAGSFKITDEGITYFEGPYEWVENNQISFSKSINPSAVKPAMTNVVTAINRYYISKTNPPRGTP